MLMTIFDNFIVYFINNEEEFIKEYVEKSYNLNDIFG